MLKARSILIALVSLCLGTWWSASFSWAKPSPCETCHEKIAPKQAKDFNRSKMAEKLDCSDCHGLEHLDSDDVDKAKLPTFETCRTCHKARVEQYLDGKHALGLAAMQAMPYTHAQPKVFIEGQKGCGGCHALGVKSDESRRYYPYGMDCQSCHTRHAFSKKEALQPEACLPCHMGFDHAQWEMWSGSKHGVTYLTNRAMGSENLERAPTCQTCHMPEGNHRVFSAWGFLGVRLPEEDEGWLADRITILKGLGVLDPSGNPTPRLDLVKRIKLARLTKEEFEAERNRYARVCAECHSAGFYQENIQNGDVMLREADRLFAEAIHIVGSLYQDGIIPMREGYFAYPDLLSFYEVNTKIELILYEMFMDHRMKTFQSSFHMNPDFATWYGFAKMKKDLKEIRELAPKMRMEAQR
ncbi:MAG: cytochrome c3 family protein [Deltaproteobacteria bacterium]|nr:cytochrome c3 family protein [Deltaproteobacteria bacterium]